MGFGEYVQRERAVADCPDCPACRAVFEGARTRQLPISFQPPQFVQKGMPRVNVARFANGGASRDYAVHMITSHDASRKPPRTGTNIVLDVLLELAGLIYFVNVGGFPQTLLIIPSRDLLDLFEDLKRTRTVHIPLPVKNAHMFPFGEYIDAWNVIKNEP